MLPRVKRIVLYNKSIWL